MYLLPLRNFLVQPFSQIKALNFQSLSKDENESIEYIFKSFSVTQFMLKLFFLYFKK